MPLDQFTHIFAWRSDLNPDLRHVSSKLDTWIPKYVSHQHIWLMNSHSPNLTITNFLATQYSRTHRAKLATRCLSKTQRRALGVRALLGVKLANAKLQFCVAQAAKDGFTYFWTVMCYISSFSELEISRSNTINMSLISTLLVRVHGSFRYKSY